MALIKQKINNLEYLLDPGIAASHCFTTRLGGVSQGYLDSLNLGMNRGDDPENVAKNYAILGKALGFDLGKLVLAHQTHSDIVRVVTAEDARGIDHRLYPECDALVTNAPGVSLGVFTADCTPILFYDPVTGAVGAAHAGWRGTAAGIAAKTIDKMVEAFGCRREDIRCAIGPNIGPCCFETDKDVPQALRQSLGAEVEPFLNPRGEKFYPDLKKINALVLRRNGAQHITVSRECTMCAHTRFWSHRYTGGLRGSQGAFITRKEDQQ